MRLAIHPATKPISKYHNQYITETIYQPTGSKFRTRFFFVAFVDGVDFCKFAVVIKFVSNETLRCDTTIFVVDSGYDECGAVGCGVRRAACGD
jgi:hypothetical protein